MPRQQPRLPTKVSTNVSGKTTIQVSERQSYTRLPVQKHDLLDKNGNIDADMVCRALNMMQDNVHEATGPARNDPLINKKIITASFTKGANVRVRHNLGAFVGAYFCTRQYVGSDPFAAVEAQYPSVEWPKGVDPTQWIVFQSSCTGTYDIAFSPA